SQKECIKLKRLFTARGTINSKKKEHSGSCSSVVELLLEHWIQSSAPHKNKENKGPLTTCIFKKKKRAVMFTFL
ncbi:hypothetical protein V4Y02_23925, partial [Escherichia coli]